MNYPQIIFDDTIIVEKGEKEMCLAIPGKIEKIFKDRQALVDFMGVKKKVALDLLENVGPGDFIIVHAGFAISRLSEKDANETINYFKQITEDIRQFQ